MSDKPSPVREMRLRQGLSIKQFAQALGISYAAASACELGHYTGVPGSWREGVEAMGASYDELHEAQQAWRCRQGANVTAGGR